MAGSYFYRKIISIVLLVAVLAVGIFPPDTALAATDARGNPVPNTSTASAPASQVTPGPSPAASTRTTDARGNPVNSGSSDPAQSSSGQSGDIECWGGIYDGFDIMGCMALGAYAVLGWVSWVLWLSAILFNYTIPYTLNMAVFIKDVPMVALGWTTFRDLSNLFFIFIILYIAISTIVGNEGYGIKKLLSKVIIGAVLINFSLFFTQAMIDVSNVFALQFYNKITQTGADQAKVVSSTDGSTSSSIIASSIPTGSSLDAGISATFVNALGLQEVWNIGSTEANTAGAKGLDPNDKKNSSLALNSRNLLVAALGGIVLVLVTAFVFFAAVMMFLARAVVLIFLMILSPLAFLGGVLPALGKYVTGEWWGKLFSNLLFAPAYMALLYLVINIIAGGQFKGVGASNGGGSGSFIGIFAGDNNMIGAAVSFFILNALMLGCLMIASKMGVIGGKWAESTGMGFAKSIGMTLSGANGAMSIARSGLGVAGGAITSIAKPFAASGVGRVIGGAALLRGGQALKDVKIGGKSYKDAQKADEERISKEYEAIKDTNTNLVQGRFETKARFERRKAAADALEEKNQARADKRIGVKVDPRTGAVTKKSFGVPSIFGGTSARYNAQKKLSKNREGDVEKSIKKPYEKAVKEAKEALKGAIHDQKRNPGPVTDAAVATAKVSLRRAQSDLKNLFNGNAPAATPTP